MTRVRLRLARFPAQFRFQFSHASARRSATENVICVAEADGVVGYGEGCPRSYVTGETITTATAFFDRHRREIETEACNLSGLNAWIAANERAIDGAPAAFAAIELALLDRFGRREGVALEALLGLPPLRPLRTSAVFGVAGAASTAALAGAYRLFGMTDVKAKLSDDASLDRRRLSIIRFLLGAKPARVDANNMFATPAACIDHLNHAQAPIWAIEEPLAARDFNGMAEIARATGARIVLDESAVSPDDIARLEGPDWIVNLRVSKHGGLLRALRMADAAQSRGLGVLVGAHVGETAILARASLALAAALGPEPPLTECGYGAWLLARDISRRRLGFGYGGRLAPRLGAAGFGLEIVADRLQPIA